MASGLRHFAFRRSSGRLSALGRVVGAAAMALVGLLVFLSVNPEAHEYFHHDANHGSHGCVVTEFAAGGAYALTPVVVVKPATLVVWAMAAAVETDRRQPVAFRLLPICGPPTAA